MSAASDAVAVPPEDAPSRLIRGDAGLGRAFIVGALIGTVVVFVVFGTIALAVGLGAGPALGVAAFTAAWGGPGMGGMVGAVMHHERTQHR